MDTPHPAYVPTHENVKELQDCIKFLLFPDVPHSLQSGKTLNGGSGWFTFAKSIIHNLGQGHERPTEEHFALVANAIFAELDLDEQRRNDIRDRELSELAKLKAKYPDA